MTDRLRPSDLQLVVRRVHPITRIAIVLAAVALAAIAAGTM